MKSASGNGNLFLELPEAKFRIDVSSSTICKRPALAAGRHPNDTLFENPQKKTLNLKRDSNLKLVQSPIAASGVEQAQSLQIS